MFVFNLVFQHISMIIAFLIGRYLFRGFIYASAVQNQLFKGINLACKTHGAYITFLLRTSFVLPFFLISYMLSVTDSKRVSLTFCLVRMKHYILGNNGLMIPSIIYIYLGASAEQLVKLFMRKDDSGSNQNLQRVELIMVCVGGLILTLLITTMSILTKR